MHYYSYHTLMPSTECHLNSIAWIKPTKIGCHGNVPWGIEKLIIYSHLLNTSLVDFETIGLSEIVKNK